jgi:hypothetical protein
MVVYNKKVSKRRRKRNGSKRKTTKPRNKKMNRSRQMGGALQPLTSPEQEVVDRAVELPMTPPVNIREQTYLEPQQRFNVEEPLSEVRNTATVQQTRERANALDQMLHQGVENQQGLCNNIKGAIGNLINRVKKSAAAGETIDLSQLAAALNKILQNVVLLNGQCEGLGELLILLETRLRAADCLEDDANGAFIGRVTNIEPPAGGGQAASD